MEKNFSLNLSTDACRVADELAARVADFRDHTQDEHVFQEFLDLISRIHDAGSSDGWKRLEKASKSLMDSLKEMSGHPAQRTVDQTLLVASAAFEIQTLLRHSDSPPTPRNSDFAVNRSSIASKENPPVKPADNRHMEDAETSSDEEVRRQIAEEIRLALNQELKKTGAEERVSEVICKPADFLMSDTSAPAAPAASSAHDDIATGSFFKIKITKSADSVPGHDAKVQISKKVEMSGSTKKPSDKLHFLNLLQQYVQQAVPAVFKESASLEVSCSGERGTSSAYDLIMPVAFHADFCRGHVAFMYSGSAARKIASAMLGFELKESDENISCTVSALTRLFAEEIQKSFAKQQIRVEFITSGVYSGRIHHEPVKTAYTRSLQFTIPDYDGPAVEAALQIL